MPDSDSDAQTCAHCGEYAAYGQRGGTWLCCDHAMQKQGLDPDRIADVKKFLDDHHLRTDDIRPESMCSAPSDGSRIGACNDNSLADGLCYVHWMRVNDLDPDNMEDLLTMKRVISTPEELAEFRQTRRRRSLRLATNERKKKKAAVGPRVVKSSGKK